MTSELALMPIAELSRRIRTRDISPVELTRAYIDCIAEIDDRIHSFNYVRTEDALREAHSAETALLRGEWSGPLHGIPVGIKDLIDVAGVPTTAQAAHRMDAIAREDAGVVRSLRRAGAIVLGKQATSEYAVGGTLFELPWPPVRNPWDLEMDASFSSSGSAAAVAAGLCAGSVGTETAGSIRNPAAWCGVAGLKPTDGLVSRRGMLALSRTMDCVGPIAWTAEDCALMVCGMVSTDPEDISRPGFAPPDISDLGKGVRELRIGVVDHFYEGDPDMDPEVIRATERSLDVLRGLGAAVSTVRLADFETYAQVARNITWPEEYAEHGRELRAHPERFAARTRSRLQDGKNVPAPDYINALRRQAELVADMAAVMSDVDVLALPTMKTPAQALGYEGTELGKLNFALTRPFNLTGGPALAVCNGFTEAGLPTSIQFVGRPFEDGTVLRVGHALERALGLRSRRPAFAEGM